MSRAAKMTLGVSMVACIGTIWGVHYMQRREREVRVFAQIFFGWESHFSRRWTADRQVMHQGVLRDDARRAARLREREEALEASREKHRAYERVQKVGKREEEQ